MCLVLPLPWIGSPELWSASSTCSKKTWLVCCEWQIVRQGFVEWAFRCPLWTLSWMDMWNKSSSSGKYSAQGVGLLVLLKFIQKPDPSTFCSSSAEQLRDCRRQQWCSCPLSPSLCYGDGFKEEQTSGWAVIQREEKRAASFNRRPADTTQPRFSGNRANVTRMEPRGVAVLPVCCRLVRLRASRGQRSTGLSAGLKCQNFLSRSSPPTLPLGHNRADKGDRSQLLKYVCMHDLCA